MTNIEPKTNNLFNFATSELSQDAFFCWSLNWLAVKEDTDDPYYKYGKAMLDLFLGENKKDIYKEVKVLKQFNRIDVLVLFKDNQDNQYALIIEDKTNTSEHNEQIEKYKNQLNDALSKDENIRYKNLSGNQIYTAYVKTGIMYTDDLDMKNKVNTTINLDKLFKFLDLFHELSNQTISTINSNIYLDYYEYLHGINDFQNEIINNFKKNQYVENYESTHTELGYKNIFQDPYAQYYFLKKIFVECDKNRNSSESPKNDEIIFKSRIYSGSNKDGTKWTQYCFWEKQFETNIPPQEKDEHESYALFWRIDNATMNKEIYPYLALRYYDKNINKYPPSPNNENNDKCRQNIFNKLQDYITENKIDENEIFLKKESRKGTIERNLLYIPIRNLDGISLTEISKVLHDINSKLTTYCKTEFENIK
ncbi:MAG: PD-(D/E)XK nuclease family protein [Solobacterium sp.]|nr:PD-(D/E)XK nuclease family protein [Solobacterium sp.]